jgi:hypothetical protein
MHAKIATKALVLFGEFLDHPFADVGRQHCCPLSSKLTSDLAPDSLRSSRHEAVLAFQSVHSVSSIVIGLRGPFELPGKHGDRTQPAATSASR